MPQVERLVDQLLRRFALLVFWILLLQDSDDDLHVVLAKTIQSKRLVRGVHFPIRPNFAVTMFCRPERDVGVESFSIPNDRRQKEEVASAFRFRF